MVGYLPLSVTTNGPGVPAEPTYVSVGVTIGTFSVPSVMENIKIIRGVGSYPRGGGKPVSRSVCTE